MKNLPNKVTPGAIEHLLAQSKVEFSVLNKKLTHCRITLPSGFIVTGESSCVDPAEYNKELGEKYAQNNAVQTLYMLEGYMLASALYEQRERKNPLVDDAFRRAELDAIVDDLRIKWHAGKPETVTHLQWDGTRHVLHHLSQAMAYLTPPLEEEAEPKENDDV